MITRQELTLAGFKLDDIVEEKDNEFDEENSFRYEIWLKQKNDLSIDVTLSYDRGQADEPFWVLSSQSTELLIEGRSHELKHITKINELRLLLYSLKM